MGEESTVVGQLALELNVDTSSLVRQLTSASSDVERRSVSIFSGMGKKIGAALGFAALTKFTADCINLGSELAEVQNVVDTTFTTLNESVNDFAKNAMTQFGLSETKAKNYVATLGAMSESMGTTEKVAYEMGTTVAGLAGDVASFYNIDADDAYTKLKGIWTGETEALKSLGVVMTQTALDQYALNNGFGKTTAKMTEQEKLMLRYQYVTNALGKATGDFAKTQDSWANQTRILSLRFDSLKASLGQGFINVLTPLLRQINLLMEGLNKLAEGFSNFTASIFGVSEASSSLGNISTGAGELSGTLDGVTESASEALRELAGFDKITKLSDASESSSNSFVTDTIINPGETKEETIATNSLAGGLKNLKDALKDLSDSFEPFKKTIGEGLYWIYTEVLVPLAKWTIGDLLPAFIETLAGAFDVLNGVLEVLKPLGSWLWDNFLKPIAQFTGGIIVDFFTDLADLLKAIGNNETACVVLGGVLTAVTAYTVGKAGYNGLKSLVEYLPKINENFSKLGKLGQVTLTIAAAFVAADVGFHIGNKIYELLSGEKVTMTASMQIEYLSDASFEEIVDGLKLTIEDFINDIKKLLGLYKEINYNENIYKSTDSNKSLKQLWNDSEAVALLKDKLQKKQNNGDDLILLNWIKGLFSSSKKGFEETGQEIGKAMAKGTSSGYTSQTKQEISAVSAGTDELVRKGIKKSYNELPGWVGKTVSGTKNNIISAIKSSESLVGMASKSLIDNGFKNQFSTLNGWIGSVATGVKNTLVNSINGAKAVVGAASTDLVNKSVKKPFEGIGTYFGNIFGNAWSTIKKSASGSNSDFGKITDSFTDTFKSITNQLIKGLNTVFTNPFKAVNDTLNKIKNVSIFGTKPFAKLWNNNPVGSAAIPMLAEGGYVKPNTPQLAMIGDNRHQGEVVAPEDKLKEMALEAVRAAGNGYNKEILMTLKLILQVLQSLDLNIIVNGKKLKDVIVDEINKQTKANGVCEIIF
ncbi:MAG: hypothetical protein K2M73_10450 [Lachnospiraceae bacterium]|nr:hypothetical protein [Lachnospiraceae bacterium]